MGATLVVLAAGRGSRFGGNKQTAIVDDAGNALLDYSMYDAVRAGFDRVVCVISPDMEDAFDAQVGRRVAEHIDVAYAYQSLDALPDGFTAPAGRTKPWGTAHAVLCALPSVPDAFVTINADDYYGPQAYQTMADFLGQDGTEHAMVAYPLANTLSEHGAVSRGVCRIDADQRLRDVVEHTAITRVGDGFVSQGSGTRLDDATLVSLNFWGFRAGAAETFRRMFPQFLRGQGADDPTGAEFFLPDVAAALTDDPGVRALTTADRWMGLTYADDVEGVQQRLASLRDQGVYPEDLWA